MVALLALGGSAGLSCDRVGPDPNGGERLYEIGKYSEARDAFRAALQHTDQPAVRYDLANAEYRMRRYEDAVKTYREALGSGLRERRLAFFNLGNAYVRAAEDAGGSAEFLQRAVTAYEEVLRLDPTDRDAKWNLELALRRMGESEEAAGSVGMGGRAEWGRGNMTKSGYAGSHQAQVGAMAGGGMGSGEGESAEELDEPTARRLLEAIEREQLSSHEGRPAGGGAKGERDW